MVVSDGYCNDNECFVPLWLYWFTMIISANDSGDWWGLRRTEGTWKHVSMMQIQVLRLVIHLFGISKLLETVKS